MKVTNHNAVFSDIVKHGMGGKLHDQARILDGEGEQEGVALDLGPLEVSAYVSEDNTLVVQIDCETMASIPQNELRVYLNNSTIYPIRDNIQSIKIEGATNGH